MGPKDILHKIWDGEFSLLQGYKKTRLTQLLGGLLPVHVVYLKDSSIPDAINVIPESWELMPDLPAGDVFAEELGIDVPYGSMIVLDGKQADSRDISDKTLSWKVGSIVGEALLCGVARGNFSLQHETDALYQSACSFHKLAASDRCQELGLNADTFRQGLASAMGGYWSGPTSSKAKALFLGSRLLDSAEVRTYLKSLDSSFTSPKASEVPASLMRCRDALSDYDEWVAFVKCNVTAELKSAGVYHRNN